MERRNRRNALEKKVGKLIQSNRRLKRRLLLARKQLNQREIEYARLVENYHSMAMNVIEINQLNGKNNANGYNAITKNLIMWAVENEKKVQQQKFLKHVAFIEAQMTSFLKLCSDMSNNVLDTKNYTRSILNSFDDKSNLQIYEDVQLGNSSTQQHIAYQYQNGHLLDSHIFNRYQTMEPATEHRQHQQVDANVAQHTAPYINGSKQHLMEETSEQEIESTSFNKVNDESPHTSTIIGHSLLSDSSTSEYSDDNSDEEEIGQSVHTYCDPEQKHVLLESQHNICNNIDKAKSSTNEPSFMICPLQPESREPKESIMRVYKVNGNFLERSSATSLKSNNERLMNSVQDDSIDEEILLEFKSSVNPNYDILKSKSNFSSSVEDELRKPINETPQTSISETSHISLDVTEHEMEGEESTNDTNSSENQYQPFILSSDGCSKESDDIAFGGFDYDSETEDFKGFTSKDVLSAIKSIEELKAHWKNVNESGVIF